MANRVIRSFTPLKTGLLRLINLIIFLNSDNGNNDISNNNNNIVSNNNKSNIYLQKM